MYKEGIKMSKLHRILIVFTVMALVAMALPQAVQAAAGPSFEIVSVKADESVTVRTKDFPANRVFLVMMDKAGNMGIDGIVVAETNSGPGGSFEATYKIPAELKGVRTIAIRFESTTGGYYTYNWFNNRSQTSEPAVLPATSIKPALSVIAVDAGNTAKVRVTGFPANTTFRIRVGPFFTFAREYVVVGTIDSGKGGSFDFTINLPDNLKEGVLAAIRLDSTTGSTHYYAYNAFWNRDLEEKTSTGSSELPQALNTCSLVKTEPSNARFSPRWDFDAVWTIKNVSNKDFELGHVDIKFISGTKMQKYGDLFDVSKAVKPGEEVKISVDMLAPSNPGTYTANWALVNSDGKVMCYLPITVTVR